MDLISLYIGLVHILAAARDVTLSIVGGAADGAGLTIAVNIS